MKAGEIAAHLDRLVEGSAAVPRDASGLVVGEPADEIDRVVVVFEVDEGTIAQTEDGSLLAAYRAPPSWPYPGAGGQAGGPARRMLPQFLRRRIALYLVPPEYAGFAGGLADWLAETLGLEEARPFGPASPRRYLKLAVFVPEGHEDRIREAIAGAGAGHIGHYSHCTFQVAGTGTFLPREGASPFAGKVGDLERAEELRLETVVPEDQAGRVVEEIGRRLGTAVRVAGTQVEVSRVAVVPGAGAEYWEHAVAAGADLLVTGDIPHSIARAAAARGMALVDPGLEATEAGFAPCVAAWLRAALGGRVQVETVSPPKLWWVAGG
ncbi:MAG TPA: hypothetical protein DEQ28_05510 [Clostridiales bacterium]|nr:hypothetical protein [Clostridiales bacterium]